MSVVVRDPVKLSRPRSKTYALTPNGLEPARTLKRPATQQVLPTLNRMVAFWVLLAGFTVLLAAYYWCQVYTGSIMLDVTAAVGAGSSYQFIGTPSHRAQHLVLSGSDPHGVWCCAVIALFDVTMRGFTLLMATAVKIQVLRRAGVPKNKCVAGSRPHRATVLASRLLPPRAEPRRCISFLFSRSSCFTWCTNGSCSSASLPFGLWPLPSRKASL